MINVTRSFLPSFEEYSATLKRAWDNGWITNNGELVLELEEKLRNYIQTDNLLFCSNGTVVLQMALKALNITKDVITTPFSYVATTNAILWEGCKPVFVDIDPSSYCIDANKIEAALTPETQAILATHVYGIACDVEKIQSIAQKYNLKVIYDAAHGFGCTYKGKSLLTFGDISTCSFHATKVFHTVEGGCIVANNDEVYQQLYLYRQFGHINDEYFSTGINAKNSEFHAAMGLCILPKMPAILEERKRIVDLYDSGLKRVVERPAFESSLAYNYSYYPVLFKSEGELLMVLKKLSEHEISARRYFYPSLNTLSFIKYQRCEISEAISKRVLCLPLYPGLGDADVTTIINIITKSIQ